MSFGERAVGRSGGDYPAACFTGKRGQGVHDIEVHAYGEAKYISAHICVDPALDVATAHDISDQVAAKVKPLSAPRPHSCGSLAENQSEGFLALPGIGGSYKCIPGSYCRIQRNQKYRPGFPDSHCVRFFRVFQNILFTPIIAGTFPGSGACAGVFPNSRPRAVN